MAKKNKAVKKAATKCPDGYKAVWRQENGRRVRKCVPKN
jgi:hypothetical protein